MEKRVRIVKKGEDDSNIIYWRTLSGIERLTHLEEMRQEVNKWKYGNQQGVQRVYRIVKKNKK